MDDLVNKTKMKKRTNPKREEIVYTLQQLEAAKKTRKFIKEQFFPVLCKSTESIHDADVFLQSFASMVMEKFLGMMKDKDFADLNLTDKLDKTSPQYNDICELVNLFNGMKVIEARDLIDGMKDEIKLFYRKDMVKRKLQDLKFNWLE